MAFECFSVLHDVGGYRDELPALFEKSFEFATLKAEHERMEKIIREKLQVDV